MLAALDVLKVAMLICEVVLPVASLGSPEQSDVVVMGYEFWDDEAVGNDKLDNH